MADEPRFKFHTLLDVAELTAFARMSDQAVLDALESVRHRICAPKDEQLQKKTVGSMTEELVKRGVYPKETVPGNPNTVEQMVTYWGAFWHIWEGVLECPHCKEDLRCHRTGPPFKREIGHYDRATDRTQWFSCPACNGNIAMKGAPTLA